MSKSPLSMREIQNVSLEILKRVTDICDQIGCKYVLAYGTLIGAVRHRGYIPWDDDVDILMPRPDYDKLVSYLLSNEDQILPLAVFCRQNNRKYIYGITRICDLRYEIFTDNEKDCGMGIFIDIYPYDGLGDDLAYAKTMMKNSSRLLADIILATRKRVDIPKTNNWKGKLVYLFNWIMHHVLGPKYYFFKQKKLLNSLPSYNESKLIGPAAWYFMDAEKVIYDKSILDELIKVPFEHYDFYIPKNYDMMLRQAYGDYMELPSIEERVHHHNYVAFKKDI